MPYEMHRCERTDDSTRTNRTNVWRCGAVGATEPIVYAAQCIVVFVSIALSVTFIGFLVVLFFSLPFLCSMRSLVR